MRTRPVSANTRLAEGHVAVFQEVLRGGQLSPIKETYLIANGSPDPGSHPRRLPPTAARIKAFIDERRGNIQRVALPKGEIRLKLVSIEEVLPDEAPD